MRLFLMVGTKESVDEHIAKKIHDMLGLTIEYVPYTHASQEQQERWYYETGHCLGGKISEIYLTLENLDSRRVILPGLGGDSGGDTFGRGETRKGLKLQQMDCFADSIFHPTQYCLAP